MIVRVRVVPNAKRNEIKELSLQCLKVYVSVPAIENKANKALVEALSGYYKVRKSQVSIVRGERSRDKVVEIKARQ